MYFKASKNAIVIQSSPAQDLHRKGKLSSDTLLKLRKKRNKVL